MPGLINILPSANVTIVNSKVVFDTTVFPTLSFTPTNFYAWYDASDSSSITLSSSRVVTWTDKSNNSNNLNIAVTTFPTYNTRTQNGLKVVDFNTQGNSIGNTFMNVPAVSQSWFIVCQVDAIYGNGASIMSYMTRNPDNGASGWQMYAYDNDVFVGALGRGTPPPGSLNLEYQQPRPIGASLNGEYHMFEVTFDRSLSATSVYLNGSLKDSKADTLPFNQITGARFRLFVNRASNQFCTGTAAEVICMNGVSATERNKIEGYLAWKWGLVSKLPSNHPYKRQRITM